jgi:hypothetical protein
MATAVGGERAIVVALVAASRLKRSDSAGRKETDMDMIRLGRTGLAVSVAGLGCGGHSRLGMARGATESDAVSIVRHALDLGVNFIDTARAYGPKARSARASRVVERMLFCRPRHCSGAQMA